MKTTYLNILVLWGLIGLVNLTACSHSDMATATPQRTSSYTNPIYNCPESNANAQNVILLIGDGMGLAQIHAAASVKQGQMHMFNYHQMGLVLTHSADNYITDSAASATAMASGVSTRNSYVGLDPNNKPLTSIFDLAKQKGLATGMVATTSAVDATLAAFFAHNSNRYNREAIAEDFVLSPPDVFIGGGRDYFLNRKDGKNLLSKLTKKGYSVIQHSETLNTSTSGKVAAFLFDDAPKSVSEGRGEFLPDAVDTAIRILSQNTDGFLLVVEGAQIDFAGHDRNLQYAVDETLDFDSAVGTALSFASEKCETLVVVTADHETGGLTIANGDLKKASVNGKFTQNTHTGIMVPIFAYGPGAEQFKGVYPNTSIFHKLVERLGLKSQ